MGNGFNWSLLHGLTGVCAVTCVKQPDSLLSNMLITAPQQLADREES